ncbi:MAG: phosphoribosyl-AMP cyclohydrolase [Actinomycetes bacterium]
MTEDQSADLQQQVVFNSDGLVPVIAQQHDTGEVLMLAWMNAEALRRTFDTGRATYWSRSRGEYWRKGDTSGHTQHVVAVRIDCDGDALLLQVDQVGPACHNGLRSCFDTLTVPITSIPSTTETPDE